MGNSGLARDQVLGRDGHRRQATAVPGDRKGRSELATARRVTTEAVSQAFIHDQLVANHRAVARCDHNGLFPWDTWVVVLNKGSWPYQPMLSAEVSRYAPTGSSVFMTLLNCMYSVVTAAPVYQSRTWMA